eukprot:gnl/TRDRNA2_/TRDRNA2_203954_c0_seq1.p1 gnl/TRDRNA2_/TRDRNA2_203954_c0~~gnl/TRDRNA2_/TRDRNA2_203954_c0_seq1.p1  ORF type:complete len:298 (-),score=34.44 gnl/TRDRNA2_/TRDRNA2_203954_c0_seq1:50-943(-)
MQGTLQPGMQGTLQQISALEAVQSSKWIVLPLLPGAAQAVTTITVGYPFDTVKTRLQLKIHPSVRSCLQAVVSSRDGLLSLYRGSTMPLCALTVKRPFEFLVFEAFNARFKGHRFATFGGGCLAGICAGVLGCPFNVVKVQMQSSSREVHANTWRAIAAVWSHAGPIGFFKGLQASVFMQVPFATLYLGTYGMLRERLPKTSLSTACAGGASSIITWTLLQPLDTMRTVIQSKTLRCNEPLLGYVEQFMRVVRARGVLGLWAGWVPVAARSIPTSAAAMLAYEWTRSIATPPDASSA